MPNYVRYFSGGATVYCGALQHLYAYLAVNCLVQIIFDGNHHLCDVYLIFIDSHCCASPVSVAIIDRCILENLHYTFHCHL